MSGDRPLRRLTTWVGEATLDLVGFLGAAGLLSKNVFGATLAGSLRGRRVPWRFFITQAARCGPHSLGVVTFVAFFVGLILALIGGNILMGLGFKEYVGKLMGKGMVVELGPLLTGVIMTGYIGAAFTAEIATMVVNDEITAMRTMALSPIRVVVAPRVLAVVLMVPCVSVVGDAVGLLGGLLVAVGVLEVGPSAYWEHVKLELAPIDVWRGAIKAVAFGLIIGVVGCTKGLRATGGAEGVGRATTNAVVTCIIAIIVTDALLNYLMLFRL